MTTTAAPSWFAVDKEGLAAQLERRGRSFAVLELLQNAIDEPDVTEVEISLWREQGRRGAAQLRVWDNAPKGFADLSHSYTFFAESTKKSNPEQRGRFNSGEKLVLAICNWAEVQSTTGTVTFHEDGHRTNSRRFTSFGSVFSAEIRFTQDDIDETTRMLRLCMIPNDIVVKFNDEVLGQRQVVHSFESTLPTEVDFKPTRRKTTVKLYNPLPGEPARIFEMGIPVVEHDGRWDINVMQRVPLNSDRDNVTPAYLRKLRVEVLNNTADLLTTDDANSVWVKDALPEAPPEVAARVFVERFGAKSAIYDPSDPEASKRLQDEGYTIIYGRSLSKDEHAALKRAEVFQPAGVLRPSGLPTSPDGEPPIPDDKLTPGMKKVMAYAADLGQELLGFVPEVVVFNMPTGRRWGGAWGGQRLSFNVGQLGHRWFNEPDVERIDALLIHEFAHRFAADHLSSGFYEACCRLGAKLRTAKTRLENF